MGLFGSKKKIFVASVVYNLAGDEADRPNYLKSLVLGKFLTDSPYDMSTTLHSGYIRGPGIKLRNFFRWSTSNYGYIGVPQGGFVSVSEIDNDVLAEAIPHDPDQTVTVSTSTFDVADFYYWAAQYMWVSHKDLFDTEWTSDYDETTNQITITFEDESSEAFTPVGFDPDASYIYATYSLSGAGSEDPVVPGSTVVLATGDSWPSIVDWDEVSYLTTPHTETLDTTVSSVASFSDGRPDETTGPTTTSSSGSWTEIHGEWSKEEYQGQDPDEDRLWTLRSFMYQDQLSHIDPVTTTNTTTEDIGGGVTKTTVTTTVVDTIILDRSYRVDTQDVTVQSFDGPYVFIYEIGSGNPELDALVNYEVTGDQYFPFIPARLDNKFISEDNYSEAYPLVKKAFKKSIGGDFDDFVEKIADNEKLSDIDYAYAVFGVSLNVQEQACREYIYRFFSELMASQATGSGAYNAWLVQVELYNDAQAEWNTWKAAQSNPADPLYGTPAPTVPAYPVLPSNEVIIKADGELDTNLDMRISWQSIEETTGTGVLDATQKVGDLWFTQSPTTVIMTGPFNSTPLRVDHAYLNWQVDEDNWKTLHLVGMVHRNYIYKGKYVEIGTKEALDDEDESGFIVPLRYQTFRSMPLTKSTQMGTACCMAVFNCYVIKKVKWYQRGWFKIFLIIVVIAISIAFPPFGGAGAGILGSAATVGAALGFSGALAIVVGTVANFVAAAILTKIIGMASTAILGDKIGAIVAAVASTVAIAVGGGLMNGQTFSASVGQLSSMSGIIGLSNSVAGGIQQYVNASIQDIQQSAQAFQKQYDSERNRIEDLYASNIGSDRAAFDPLNLTGYVPYTPETPEVFLGRTMMTGSDNIEMAQAYVTNFAELTLSTKLSI